MQLRKRQFLTRTSEDGKGREVPFQAGRTFAKTRTALQELGTDIKNRTMVRVETMPIVRMQQTGGVESPAEACTSAWKLAARSGSQAIPPSCPSTPHPIETAVGCWRLYVNDLNVTFKS